MSASLRTGPSRDEPRLVVRQAHHERDGLTPRILRRYGRICMRAGLRVRTSIAAFALVWLAGAAPSAQNAPHKKPITHDVYDSWKSIQGTKLSRDGAWVAYALTLQDGDGELVVRNLKTSAEYRA